MVEWVLKLTHPKLLYQNATLSIGFVVPSLIHVILCFVLLGISASEYLCPSVAQLTDSDSNGTGTLMAVLLSWCNSSPDLFSNLMSWTTVDSNDESINAAALSVGEVLGACGIILCIVIGAICVIMSSTSLNFEPHQRVMILRDLSFLLMAVAIMWYICIQNKVTLLNCLIMIMIYVVYLVLKFTLRVSAKDEEDTSILTEQEPLGSNRIKPNIISAMDVNNLLHILENSRELNDLDRAELVTMGGNVSHDNGPIYIQSRPISEPLNSVTNRMDAQLTSYSAPMTFQPYSDDPEAPQNVPIEQLITPRTSVTKKRLNRVRDVFFEIFTPHLQNFGQKTLIDACLSIIIVPFVILLRLSCPQPGKLLEYDDSKYQYITSSSDISLLFVQSILCPAISCIILLCLLEKEFTFVYLLLVSGCSAVLLAFTLSFYKTLLSYNQFSLTGPITEMSFETDTNDEMSDERRMIERMGNLIINIFLLIGIINVILWISIIANSLIEVLDIYQKITSISQGILGLTIFAWGNSISDLISNIAMCRLYQKMPLADHGQVRNTATKFFIISCTSCLGGALLNSMVGIGVSGLISMSFVHKSSDKSWFRRFVDLGGGDKSYNHKFIVSCCALTLQILVLIVFFSSPEMIHEWFKKNMRHIGLLMCSIWFFATLINVCLETFS